MSMRICGFESINTAQDEQRNDKESNESDGNPLMRTAIIQLIFGQTTEGGFSLSFGILIVLRSFSLFLKIHFHFSVFECCNRVHDQERLKLQLDERVVSLGLSAISAQLLL